MKAAALISIAAVALVAGLTSTAGASPSPSASCATQGRAGRPFATGANCRLVAVDGYPRRYVVWMSAKARAATAAGKRVPLVLMLHGSGGSGERFLAVSGWREQADSEGFVAAFPTGARFFVTQDGRDRWSTKWNSYGLVDDIDPTRRPAGYPKSAPWPADDIAFLRAPVADVERETRIDPKRVFLSGFSNGGAMCARAGVEMSDVLAAVGCNPGGLQGGHPTTLGHPHVPMVLTYGQRDQKALKRLRTVEPGVAQFPLDPARLLGIKAVATVIGTHLSALGLDASPSTSQTTPVSTRLRWRTALPGNEDRNEFDLLVLAGVTHEYPNGRNNPNGFAMTSLLWPFFEAHPLR